MNTSAKVSLSVLAGFVLLIVFIVSSYFSYANKAVDFETHIENAVKDNKQQLGQYRLGVVEAVGALGLGADLQAKAVTDQIEARYGKGGSQAVMQWITENNQAGVGPTAIETIMRQIQAGRQGFTNSQTRLLDVCRGFDKLRRQPYSGFWVRMAGYPSADFLAVGGSDVQCRAVTSKGANKAFESGVEESLDIRSGAPDA